MVISGLLHMAWNPDPVMVRLGATEIRYYGVLLVLGICGSFLLWYRRARAAGEERKLAEAWLWWCVPAILLGARLGEFLFYRWRDFAADPWIAVRSHGGMSSHGVTVALVLAMWGFSRRYKRALLRIADYQAPGLAIGASCVRLGNFINSEIVGRQSDVPWAIVFPRYDIQSRHPVQLYEMAAALAALAVLIMAERHRRDSAGTGLSIGIFLFGYFSLRFFAEFFKEWQVEQLREAGGPLAMLEAALGVQLTTGQWLSFVPAGVGAVLIVRALRRDAVKGSR